MNTSLTTLALVIGLAAITARGETPVMNATSASSTGRTEIATFGAGCFWCAEAVFQHLKGVRSVVSGYQGGRVKNPTYKQVCEGDTGHAEVIRVEFDPAVVPYTQILDTFWEMHDPTTPNRQGADVGEQYRSVIFFHSEEQRRAAEEAKIKLGASGKFAKPIVTEIVAAQEFYPAEGYHQDYYNRNPDAPYCRMVIAPKLKKLGIKP